MASGHSGAKGALVAPALILPQKGFPGASAQECVPEGQWDKMLTVVVGARQELGKTLMSQPAHAGWTGTSTTPMFISQDHRT